MPATETTPAAGTSTTASAQVLNRLNLIVVDSEFADASSGAYRVATETPVNNLPKITVNLFLYPEYDSAAQGQPPDVYPARNYIAWRVLARMSPALNPTYIDVISANTVPLCTPQLLPVGKPISITFDGGGVEAVLVEFDTTGGDPVGNQGRDRVIISISAAQ